MQIQHEILTNFLPPKKGKISKRNTSQLINTEEKRFRDTEL